MTTTTDAIERLCASLTLEDKVALLTGRDFWNTVAIERIGLRQHAAARTARAACAASAGTSASRR